MFHFRRFFAGMTPAQIAFHRFYFTQDACSPGLVESFLGGDRTAFPVLDAVELDRGVYLLESSVLKYNRIKHWRVRLKKHLGLGGRRGDYCLVNEFANLLRPEVKGLAPALHGFGWNSVGMLQDVYLMVEYLPDAKTVDEALTQQPSRAEEVLNKVLMLFQEMLARGFVHMDPHPKNIMLMPDGTMKLIDFECCSFNVEDLHAALGFLLGYFYHYWFQRFMPVDRYDEICLSFMEREYPLYADDRFRLIYHHFRDAKVSRKKRYAVLNSSRASNAFLKACRLASSS